jgi:ATP-dependent protease ClpP protease subunit
MVSGVATEAQLHIMGDITHGHWLFGKADTDTDAADVAQALAELPATVGAITVHINSYGGEVAEGVAIYNALKAHPAKVTTVCEGFACSIASVVFMAGDERVMRPASMLMLHNASMPANGDANAHRKAADDLDTITELSRTAYLEHATDELTPERLAQVMDAETWVKPETALEWGLATQVDGWEGSAEPTQSARELVARRLTSAVAQVAITREQMAEIARGVADRLVGECGFAEAELEQFDLPEPEPEAEPEPERPSERYARIFQNLSSM